MSLSPSLPSFWLDYVAPHPADTMKREREREEYQEENMHPPLVLTGRMPPTTLDNYADIVREKGERVRAGTTQRTQEKE